MKAPPNAFYRDEVALRLTGQLLPWCLKKVCPPYIFARRAYCVEVPEIVVRHVYVCMYVTADMRCEWTFALFSSRQGRENDF